MTLQDVFLAVKDLLENQNQILKVVLILLSTLFLLFTIIVSRQISLLTVQLNQVSFSPVLKFIGYLLILATITILIAVIFV